MGTKRNHFNQIITKCIANKISMSEKNLFKKVRKKSISFVNNQTNEQTNKRTNQSIINIDKCKRVTDIGIINNLIPFKIRDKIKLNFFSIFNNKNKKKSPKSAPNDIKIRCCCCCIIVYDTCTKYIPHFV